MMRAVSDTVRASVLSLSKHKKSYKQIVEQLENVWIVVSRSTLCKIVSKARKEQNLKAGMAKKSDINFFKNCKVNFPKVFMIVAALTGRGTLQIIKAPKYTKINSQFCVSNVLKPLFEKYLPKLYKNEIHKIFFHHDKATSHTSKYTTEYLDKCPQKYGLKYLKKYDIPVKSPDCSPCDFFSFGYFKQKLKYYNANSLNKLWNACKKVWKTITLVMVQSVFENRKKDVEWFARNMVITLNIQKKFINEKFN